MNISWMRAIGFAVSLLLFVILFLSLRRHRTYKSGFFFLLFSAISLFTVSIFPDLVEFPTKLIELNRIPGGRIITLLILVIIFMWIVMLFQRSETTKLSNALVDLVQALALREFFDEMSKEHGKHILLLIPALNEEENLKKVLSEIPKTIMGLPIVTLVIDDGSSDQTANVIRKFRCLSVRHSVNIGGGAALRTGYKIAKTLSPEAIVTMDADGQHDPSEIPSLVEPILLGDADVVIGSRILGHSEKYSMLRSIGVTIFSLFIRGLVGKDISDCSSGYRAFNPQNLQKLNLIQDQYHTAELLIDAAKRGYRIVERPIHIRSRFHGKSKKGSEFYYALSFIRSIFKTWIR